MKDEIFSVVKAFLIMVDAFLETETANKAGNPDPRAKLSSNSY